MTDPSRARGQEERLRRPELAPLWARARERIERHPDKWEDASVSISVDGAQQRAEVEALIGRSLRGDRTRVRLGDLDGLLRRGALGLSLPQWLSRIGPALRDRPRERAERDARIAEAVALLRTSRHAVEPWFAEWLERMERAGTLRRLHTQARLDVVRTAVAVLDRLPSAGIPRPRLAAETAGDPKALDGGPLASVVLSALAVWAEEPLAEDEGSIGALWERFDVYGDALASQVLALGLRPVGDDALACWLRAAAEEGHPVVLTRRDVARSLGFVAGSVFVCENPSVVHEAAARLGRRSPPLLCTNGRPHATFWRLGDALVSSGATLHYHGDLDPAGVDIAGAVIRRLSARPWRLSAADYDEDLARVPEVRWRGQLAPRAQWDRELERRMTEVRRVVYEEHVVDLLLEDLARAAP